MGDDMITEGMLDMFIFETEQGLENLENICLESKDVGEFDEDNGCVGLFGRKQIGDRFRV